MLVNVIECAMEHLNICTGTVNPLGPISILFYLHPIPMIMWYVLQFMEAGDEVLSLGVETYPFDHHHLGADFATNTSVNQGSLPVCDQVWWRPGLCGTESKSESSLLSFLITLKHGMRNRFALCGNLTKSYNIHRPLR